MGDGWAMGCAVGVGVGGDNSTSTITTTSTTPTPTAAASDSNRSTTVRHDNDTTTSTSTTTTSPTPAQQHSTLESSPPSGVADRVHPQPQRPCTQASRLHSSAPQLRASHLTTASAPAHSRSEACPACRARTAWEGCSNGQPARAHHHPPSSTLDHHSSARPPRC